MPRPIPVSKKLQAIINQIDKTGDANITRLTVLKKWFEEDLERLAAFGLWMARRAASYGGQEACETAGKLFEQARKLLAKQETLRSASNRVVAEDLYRRLRAFQDTYKRVAWGSVRIIRDRNLLLIEEGLAIYLWRRHSPTEGYRLAATYCRHYDPGCFNDLTRSSRPRLIEVMEFVQDIEAREKNGAQPRTRR